MKLRLLPAIFFVCVNFSLAVIAVVWAEQPGFTYSLQVDGLACPFCAYGIEKKLKAIKGVVRLEVDIGKGIMRVTMTEGVKLDEATARKAVEAAGFTLRHFSRTEQR